MLRGRPPCKKLPKRKEELIKITDAQDIILERPLFTEVTNPPIRRPYHPSDTGLIVAFGYLQGKQIGTLFDPGSETSLVDKDFCETHNIAYSPSKNTAKIANNEIQQLHGTNRQLNLAIQGYKENI